MASIRRGRRCKTHLESSMMGILRKSRRLDDRSGEEQFHAKTEEENRRTLAMHVQARCRPSGVPWCNPGRNNDGRPRRAGHGPFGGRGTGQHSDLCREPADADRWAVPGHRCRRRAERCDRGCGRGQERGEDPLGRSLRFPRRQRDGRADDLLQRLPQPAAARRPANGEGNPGRVHRPIGPPGRRDGHRAL